MASTNEGIRHICNVFSHCLTPLGHPWTASAEKTRLYTYNVIFHWPIPFRPLVNSLGQEEKHRPWNASSHWLRSISRHMSQKITNGFCPSCLLSVTLWYLWLSKVSANEGRRYARCNVSSHWLGPCSAIEIMGSDRASRSMQQWWIFTKLIDWRAHRFGQEAVASMTFVRVGQTDTLVVWSIFEMRGS